MIAAHPFLAGLLIGAVSTMLGIAVILISYVFWLIVNEPARDFDREGDGCDGVTGAGS